MRDIESIEALRLEKVARRRRRLRIALALGIMLGAPLVLLDYHAAFVWQKAPPAATLVFAVLMYLWVSAPARAYKREWKKSVLPVLAAEAGLVYDSAGGLSRAELEPSLILPHHHVLHAEDFFSGTWKGARLRFNEMRLEEKRKDSRGKNYAVTVFRGLAVLIDFPAARFYGRTVVEQKKILSPVRVLEASTGLKRAGMVDPVFAKDYVVLTDDQVEARYLVHPALVARLAEQGGGLSLSFWDRQVLLLLRARKDLFEPPRLSLPADAAPLKAEIGAVLDFIDYLDLYRPPA